MKKSVFILILSVTVIVGCSKQNISTTEGTTTEEITAEGVENKDTETEIFIDPLVSAESAEGYYVVNLSPNGNGTYDDLNGVQVGQLYKYLKAAAYVVIGVIGDGSR